MRKQKWGIALVSFLIWIGAVVTIVGSLFALLMGGSLVELGLNIGLPDFSAYVTSAAIVSLFIGILYLLLGYFLWIQNFYAWWIVFLMTFVGILLTIPAFFTFSPVVFLSIILPVIILVALTHKESMQACKIRISGWSGWG